MAKIQGPLLSLGATGSLAKTITYQLWKGIRVARSYSKPTGPATLKQLDVRNRFGYLAHLWSTYDWYYILYHHDTWQALCTHLGIASTGIGQFISEYYHRAPATEVFFKRAFIGNDPESGDTNIIIWTNRPNVEVYIQAIDSPYPTTAPTLTYLTNGDGNIIDTLPFYWNYNGTYRCFSDFAARHGSTGLHHVPGP